MKVLTIYGSCHHTESRESDKTLLNWFLVLIVKCRDAFSCIVVFELQRSTMDGIALVGKTHSAVGVITGTRTEFSRLLQTPARSSNAVLRGIRTAEGLLVVAAFAPVIFITTVLIQFTP